MPQVSGASTPIALRMRSSVILSHQAQSPLTTRLQSTYRRQTMDSTVMLQPASWFLINIFKHLRWTQTGTVDPITLSANLLTTPQHYLHVLWCWRQWPLSHCRRVAHIPVWWMFQVEWEGQEVGTILWTCSGTGELTCLWSHSNFNTNGSTPLQVALQIFWNKTAAQIGRANEPYDPTKKAKGPNNIIIWCSIMDVTPRMIAYAAVQVIVNYYLAHIPTISAHTQSIDIHWALIYEGMGYHRLHL